MFLTLCSCLLLYFKLQDMMVSTIILLTLLASIACSDLGRRVDSLYMKRINMLQKFIKTKECNEQVINSFNTYTNALITESHFPFENVLFKSKCESDVTLFPPLVS